MKFIAPEFLYALGFLAIPILIHLFNFRRYKTVKFSQVRFLKDIKQETQSVSRLKHLFILLSRILAISALVIAFAQPYFPAQENAIIQGRKGISIYIDNSFSMQVEAEKGRLIDVAKEKSIALVGAYNESDKFHLVTNDFKSKNQRWLNKKQVILEIQKIGVSPMHRTLKEVLGRMDQLPNEEGLIRIKYLVSDLQQSSFNIEEIVDSSNFFLLAVQNTKGDNVVLDQLDFQLPYHLSNQNEAINFTLKTQDITESKKVSAQLYLNQQLKTPLSIDIEQEDSIVETVNYRTNIQDQVLGLLSIKDYPVSFDDTLFFNYSIQNRINVLHLYEENANASLAALFETDSLIHYTATNVKQIDYSQFDKNSLIILDEISAISSGLRQELIAFIESNGSLSIFPHQEMVVDEMNALLNGLNIGGYTQLVRDTQKVAEINNQSQLLQRVFKELPKNLLLPTAYQHWTIKSNRRSNSENIMSFQNQHSFLKQINTDKGSVYLAAVGLSTAFSNFSQHALFVPSLYNMALQSVKSEPLYYDLNKAVINLQGVEKKESPLHIVGQGVDFIPKQQYIQNQLQISLQGKLKKAGHYQLIRNGEVIRDLSFNYSRNESNLALYSPQEIMEKAELLGANVQLIEGNVTQLSKTISEIDKGTTLWKYFIILALVFLGVEMALLRILN